MSNIISNLLSRRGRKGVHETQLDSVWGDVRITSPTDTALVWSSKHDPLDVYTGQEDTPDLSEGATPVDDSMPTPIDQSIPRINQKFAFEGASNDSLSILTYFSSPSQTLTVFPEHTAAFMQQPQKPIEHATSVLIDSTAKATTSANGSAGRNNALAIFGVNLPVCGTVSPTSSADKTPAHSLVASPVLSEHSDEQNIYIPSRRGLSPVEISALARRPKIVDRSIQEQSQAHTTMHAQYSSLNANAIQSSHSPEVRILSPVSEEFLVEGQPRGEDGIVVVDRWSNQSGMSLQSQSSRCQSMNYGDHTQGAVLSSLSTTVSTRPLLSEPDNNHITATMSSLNHPSHPQGERLLMIGENEEVYICIAEASRPVVGGACSEQMEISQIEQDLAANKNPPVETNFYAYKQEDVSYETAAKMKSPPMSVTSKMRVHSPQVGTIARTGVGIARVSTGTSGLCHRRNKSRDSQDDDWSAVRDNQQVPKVRTRLRSASLEPPLSPSLLEHEIPPTKGVTVAAMLPRHRRLQSDRGFPCTYISGSQSKNDYLAPINFGNGMKQIRPKQNNGVSVIPKRLRSQTTPESLDSSEQQVMSTSPLLQRDLAQHGAPGVAFYDEVKNDYRLLSLESRVARNEAFLARMARSDNIRDDRKDKKPRSKSVSRVRERSLSRVRDRSRQRQPQEEPKTVDSADLARLVPSYEELWT